MVKCTVEHHFSAVIVRFTDGKSLLIQGGDDQEAFAQDCGTELSCITDIERCAAEYYDFAEFE